MYQYTWMIHQLLPFVHWKQTGTLTNSEDSDEMLQNAAFHQSQHSFLKLKQPIEKEVQFYMEL